MEGSAGKGGSLDESGRGGRGVEECGSRVGAAEPWLLPLSQPVPVGARGSPGSGPARRRGVGLQDARSGQCLLKAPLASLNCDAAEPRRAWVASGPASQPHSGPLCHRPACARGPAAAARPATWLREGWRLGPPASGLAFQSFRARTREALHGYCLLSFRPLPPLSIVPQRCGPGLAPSSPRPHPGGGAGSCRRGAVTALPPENVLFFSKAKSNRDILKVSKHESMTCKWSTQVLRFVSWPRPERQGNGSLHPR